MTARRDRRQEAKRFLARLAGITCTLLVLLSSKFAIASTEFIGVGIADHRNSATELAFADLAQQLFVKVETDSQSYRNNKGVTNFQVETRTSSDIPLLGVRTSCVEHHQGYRCEAALDPVSAGSSYQQQLNSISGEILRLEGQFESVAASDSGRIAILLSLLKYQAEFSRYAAVAMQFGVDISQSDRGLEREDSLMRELISLRRNAMSVEAAASLILSDMGVKQAEVLPPFPEKSREVTPFGQAVQRELLSQMVPGAAPSETGARLSGTYTVSDTGVDLNYVLRSKSGELLARSIVRLNPRAYRDYRVDPVHLDFDTLLHKGYVVSKDFSVLIATNKGSRDLLFTRGEELELLVKLNKPGYFYLVGHSASSGREMSYIVDLQDGLGERKFIRYVNADDANKWISIGEFEVVPPFGLESIQVIAGSEDLSGSLPAYRYDAKLGYYVVSDEIADGLQKARATRSLRRKKAASMEDAEAVLMFSTSEAGSL